jgi:hypothetical protein
MDSVPFSFWTISDAVERAPSFVPIGLEDVSEVVFPLNEILLVDIKTFDI